MGSGWLSVQLRRQPFGWELSQWNCFLLALKSILIRRGIPDALAWTFCPDGIFSVKSFRKCLEEKGGLVISASCPMLWLGFVPPKIEIFFWQLLKGRILVREVLKNFGYPLLASTECPLLERETESMNHLFLQCTWSWKLWPEAMGWWGISSYSNNDLHGWIEGWPGLYVSKASQRTWFVLYFAVCWTIWENQNAVVFDGKEASFSMAIDSVKFRLALWFKNCGAGSNEDLTILLLDVKRWCVDKIRSKSKVLRPWSHPNDHDIVFNVDESSRGNPGLAGIGGVLRDVNEKVLCLFSSCVGLVDSNLAEVLAIHRACELISSNMYFIERNITILSDSKFAVSWINGDGFDHLNFVSVLYDIKQFLSSKITISIEFTDRSSNSLAYVLAKAGSGLQQERLEWGL
ncbi:hypothetical protein Ddye_015807 [Dipteronia dyeriana]|uniref:RNase H type-1 domain-containing protein n=1 Tax=Dipteronia dyeriana TaxID=168575 RepID=A0AAD9WZI0_9ROSI|nr:hypothetical protein Ddye_015807 [Dipteronia dyeriana]